MGFPIPDPFVWDDSYRVHYFELDHEHTILFKAVLDLSKDPSHGGVLAYLVDVTAQHFSDEEARMRRARYPEYSAHKQAHDDFQKKIRGWSAPVSEEDIKFAKEWLVDHIKGTDFKYKGKL